MTNKRAIEIIQKEQECVKQNRIEGNCYGNCSECGFMTDAKDVMEAYDMALRAMKMEMVWK